MRGTLLKMSTYRHFIYSCVHFRRRALDQHPHQNKVSGSSGDVRTEAPEFRRRRRSRGGRACWCSWTSGSGGAGPGYLQVRNPSTFQDVRHICVQAPRPRGCSVLPSGATRTDGPLCARDETDLSRPCGLGQRSPRWGRAAALEKRAGPRRGGGAGTGSHRHSSVFSKTFYFFCKKEINSNICEV